MHVRDIICKLIAMVDEDNNTPTWFYTPLLTRLAMPWPMVEVGGMTLAWANSGAGRAAQVLARARTVTNDVHLCETAVELTEVVARVDVAVCDTLSFARGCARSTMWTSFFASGLPAARTTHFWMDTLTLAHESLVEFVTRPAAWQARMRIRMQVRSADLQMRMAWI